MMYESLTQSPPPFYFVNRLKFLTLRVLLLVLIFFKAPFLLLPVDVICSQDRI